MVPQLQLNISLNPVVEYDSKTDRYVTYYEEFPQAIAVGRTQEEAEINLIHIVEAMWRERKEELREMLKQKYINDSHKNNYRINMTFA